MRDVNVSSREANFFVHFAESDRVRSLAAFSAADKILLDAVGAAHEGAVFADDGDTGA